MQIITRGIHETADAAHPLQAAPNHFGMSVIDLQEAIDWYREILGFGLERLSERRSDDGEVQSRVAFLKRDGFRLELFEICDGNGNIIRQERTLGSKHFAFTVPSIADALAFLRARNVDIALTPDDIPNMVVLSCFMRDPSGNFIELIEPFPAWWLEQDSRPAAAV